MEITCISILILVCIFLYSCWDTLYRRRNLPPGPTPLPLIGTLLHIRRGELVNSLMKLWDQYGSVYTLYFGPRPVVVLCGYDAVKEALIDHDEEFGARCPLPVLERFAKGYGITLSNGERWKLTRSFTVKTLKSFGFGKKSIEWKIQTEAQCIVDEFRKSNGQPFDPHKKIMEAIANVLCSIIFGDRFEYKDERFAKLLEFVDDSFQLTSSTWGQLHSILPILMDHFPGPHQRIAQIAEEMVEFIYERVKANLETLDPSSPRHFIDSFLIKLDEEKSKPYTIFNLRNLLVTTQNLIIAGTETVSTTLRYGLLILLKYPDVQAKLHEEIDQGTEIYPLLCTVHRDPKQFSSPWKFNPNHFLDESGNFKKNDALMAFSAGKRICPGKNMACMELFIFLTTILQNFKLTSPTEITDADIAPRMKGFLNAPITYKLSCLPRQI
ncbi:cytochrome P450 2G1-like isoform X2 [Dendropsophus ebraccatus]|uniref:cytochrome P450 2G1-like isoform X2 n=1 Tax=Dendropsophus ebraccatus TaxID=150705 RepID=UPI0038321A4A